MTDSGNSTSENNKEQFIRLLVCPASRSPLVYTEDRFVCADEDCRLAFPIWDDIPILLIDEAEQLTESEWLEQTSAQG